MQKRRMHFSPILHNTIVAFTVQGCISIKNKAQLFFSIIFKRIRNVCAPCLPRGQYLTREACHLKQNGIPLFCVNQLQSDFIAKEGANIRGNSRVPLSAEAGNKTEVGQVLFSVMVGVLFLCGIYPHSPHINPHHQ